MSFPPRTRVGDTRPSASVPVVGASLANSPLTLRRPLGVWIVAHQLDVHTEFDSIQAGNDAFWPANCCRAQFAGRDPMVADAAIR